MTIRPALLVTFAVTVLAGCVDEVTTGAGDYQQFCAACHGATGKGDGDAAPALDTPPADLTQISARNGGRFPRDVVMSKIYGYTRTDQHGATMPGFGPLLEGKTVLYDSGDGKQTPTPWRLVAIAEYLETIQPPTK